MVGGLPFQSVNAMVGDELVVVAQSVHYSSPLEHLLKNLKLYLTTSQHTGNLYEHSIWASRAIVDILRDNGIVDSAKIRLHVLAALLHDVGKAGDLKYEYYTKPTHPKQGFNYLIGLEKFCIEGVDAGFDFHLLFDSLGLSEQDRLFVAIIAGMHHEISAVRDAIAKGSGAQALEDMLKKLDGFIATSGYCGGRVDHTSDCYRQLLQSIYFVTYADVRALDIVRYDPERHEIINSFFDIDFSEQANAPGVGHFEGSGLPLILRFAEGDAAAAQFIFRTMKPEK